MMKISRIGRLGRDESGSSAIEFALLAPVLVALLLGTVTIFDVFRNVQAVEKATYTVGDMLSRETSVDMAKLNGMLTLMRNIVPTASDGGLRISSISRVDDKFVVDWTRDLGQAVPSTPLPASLLPTIANGDSVLLTESFVPHRAFIATFGFDFLTFGSQSVHRPRFVSSIPLN